MDPSFTFGRSMCEYESITRGVLINAVQLNPVVF